MRWSSGSVFAADQEVHGSNPTLASTMNLWGSTRPRCKLVPWEGYVCASLIFLGAVCLLICKDGIRNCILIWYYDKYMHKSKRKLSQIFYKWKAKSRIWQIIMILVKTVRKYCLVNIYRKSATSVQRQK